MNWGYFGLLTEKKIPVALTLVVGSIIASSWLSSRLCSQSVLTFADLFTLQLYPWIFGKSSVLDCTQFEWFQAAGVSSASGSSTLHMHSQLLYTRWLLKRDQETREPEVCQVWNREITVWLTAVGTVGCNETCIFSNPAPASILGHGQCHFESEEWLFMLRGMFAAYDQLYPTAGFQQSRFTPMLLLAQGRHGSLHVRLIIQASECASAPGSR